LKTNESLAVLMDASCAKRVKPWLSLAQGLSELSQIGINIDRLTLIHIIQERDIGHQPRGKNGKWWIERSMFDQFKKNPGRRLR